MLIFQHYDCLSPYLPITLAIPETIHSQTNLESEKIFRLSYRYIGILISTGRPENFDVVTVLERLLKTDRLFGVEEAKAYDIGAYINIICFGQDEIYLHLCIAILNEKLTGTSKWIDL